MRRPLFITVLVVGVGAVPEALAQDQPEGPVVVGQRREQWKGFDLERFNAAFEFLGQYQSEKLSQSTGTVKATDSLLREDLSLDGEASIGHKNFIDLIGTVKLGLDNRRTESDTAGESVNEWDFLNLYDVRALLLQNGPVPTTIYSKRDESIINQGFGGSQDQTIFENGVIAQVKSERAPTTFQYFHRDLDLTNPLQNQNSYTRQDSFTAQSAIKISERQRLDIAYTFDHINENEQNFYTDDYDRNDLNIVHELDFGKETRNNSLRSSLRYYDQGGRSSQSDLRWDELLLLRHTDHLETRYRTTIDQQTRAGLEQTLYHGDANIRHQLFDSLVSSASVGAERLDADSEHFTSDDLFVVGQLDYTKKAGKGRIDASAAIAYDLLDNSDRGEPLAVTNQPHTFDGLGPVVLNRSNIVVGSVTLFASGGFPQYREGIDYTVAYFPDRAEITIPIGSAIQPGQSFLTNYEIGPEPGSRIATTGTTFGARYTFTEGTIRGLSLYSTYRTVDHDVTSSQPELIILDNFRDLLLGVEYNRSGIDLKYEHEIKTSNVDPFNTDRFLANYTQALGRDSTISLDFSHESIDYTLQDTHTDYDRATGIWNQRVTTAFSFNVRLEYRNQRDSINGRTQGFEQIVGFNWHKAQTSVYGSFQNAFVNGPGSDQTSQLFQLGLRRDF
jgi:hypothetical protein